MHPALAAETELLRRSWDQHPPEMLRDYLVADIHDPRINPQSIRGRHFLLTALCGDRFRTLAEEEFRFAAVLNWLRGFADPADHLDAWHALEHSLRVRADNVEGLPLPAFVRSADALLPRDAAGLTIPNYLRDTLQAGRETRDTCAALAAGRDTFARLWRQFLDPLPARHLSVIEPACGSANDYRAFQQFGLARHLDYLGFDLCAKNITNAQAMFPGARFETGNVFEIRQPDHAFDFCIVHDLLEHLSPAGLEQAVAEICRVTQQGIFIGFFQLHENPEHVLRPVANYHWNTLSLPRVRALFEPAGIITQAIHVNSWLQTWLGGRDSYYYDSAYDLLCFRSDASKSEPQ